MTLKDLQISRIYSKYSTISVQLDHLASVKMVVVYQFVDLNFRTANLLVGYYEYLSLMRLGLNKVLEWSNQSCDTPLFWNVILVEHVSTISSGWLLNQQK